MFEPGDRLRFDRVLLATGATRRRLGIPGADLANILYQRTVAVADAISLAPRPGNRAPVRPSRLAER